MHNTYTYMFCYVMLMAYRVLLPLTARHFLLKIPSCMRNADSPSYVLCAGEF